MIHILDFNSEIIDFFDKEDSNITVASYSKEEQEGTEMFDLEVTHNRSEYFKDRNRIIIQDPNGIYREFIISKIVENENVEVQCNASYMEDISRAKPIPPGNYTKMTINEALLETLKDTGWEVGICEYAGIKTMSWTSVRTPYEMISQLTTTYGLVPDYEIEIKGNEVVSRKVNMRKPVPLFEGKEIEYGKDLITMEREEDFSEVVTALFAFGPEKEDGSRISTVVVDDDAQEQFNLPKRYLWAIYEPESEDQNMTLDRLTTLAKTELNKHKSSVLAYTIEAADLVKQFPHEIIRYGDIVRIKNPDFEPNLYAESEVIGIEYDLISEACTYKFGNVIEYKEDDLLKYFRSRMEEIEKKLNNNINNSNTIITDRIEEEIERLQRIIHRGATPPTSPEEGDFWYDTSNSKVAVLREFKNGRWENASAHDVEQIGGMTKEAIIYNEINGTFLSISVQHAKVINEVYEVLNSEYLVDEGIRDWLNNELNILLDIYSNITSSLDSMTVETATIGKLMDTQAMIVQYRGQAYALNTALLNARQAIDERFKLLQSQYTDEKYNEAMQKVADVIGGTYDEETGQLIADIPSKETLEEMRVTIENAMNNMSQENEAKLQELQNGITQTNQRITATNEELSAGITSVTKKVDGMQVGGRNLLQSFTEKDRNNINPSITSTQSFDFTGWATELYSANYLKNVLKEGKTYTLSYELEITELATSEMTYSKSHGMLFHIVGGISSNFINTQKSLEREIGNKMVVKHTFTINTLYDYRLLAYTGRYTADGTANGLPVTYNKARITNLKLEEGNMATAWTPAPEDSDKQLSDIKTSVQTQSADIQLIKDGIKLKADSSEVTKIYDNYLTPLQTQVNQQKATLDILPSQIASKVSQSQYTADMNNVVGRLNTADSERTQLGNEIRDRVTLNEYQTTKDKIDNLKIGGKNLVLDSYGKYTNHTAYGKFYNLSEDWIVGETYTVTIKGQPNTNHFFGVYTDDGYAHLCNLQYNEKLDLWIGTGVAKASTRNKPKQVSVYDMPKDGNYNATIQWIQVEKGTIYTDYNKAPEDTAERLKTMETGIEQNGIDISLRAKETDLNKTKQTLSKIAAEILVNTTTGVTLKYDENGTVSDVTVGPSGVKLNTNVFEINDGDVIVKNGVTTIKDAYIDKLFSKQATINYLNSVDITAKRIEAKDNKATVNIENGTITMNRTDGYKLDMGINGITMTNPNGSTRFTMNTTFVQSAALGTSNANVYLAAQQGYEVRAVDITQIPSDGAWDSYRYVPLRALAFVGNKLMTNGGTNLYLGTDNEVRVTARGGYNGEDTVYRNMRALGYYGDFIETNSVTSGVNIYIRPDSNAEVRFTARGTTDNYIDIRAKNVYGSSLIARDSGNLYLGTDDGVRITGKSLYNGGSPIWRNLAANGLYANFLDINPNTNAANLYLRADNEIRITKRNTTDSYIPIRAASATWTSSERYKYDIENWDIDVLEHLVDRVQLYSYKLYSEIEEDSQRVRHGVVLERETPDEWKNGDGVDSYEMTAWCLKAIQELTKKVRRLETELEAK
ncbi:phage tail spike protein [Mammaliicoccus sciuri]|uniref:phage tail spike protein n=1 Tax=Mammaliicoccus sciuri TaxID=1296 RepID=UPI000CD1C52F|nr:phage tail spike protein [Mammaliicoccus sciuri]PNZ29968.1 hypothetical protein CD114_01045 [Mammaliicoccus sciuri]